MDILGVDVGGVIIDRVDPTADTSFFSDNYLETPAVSGAFDALDILGKCRFKEIYIVSKCGERVEDRTRRWMEYHGFFEKAGILRENLFFCRTRKGKAPLCEKLGIHFFVDDRLEVLSHLKTVPHQFLFNGDIKEAQRFSEHLPKVTVVNEWKELVEKITARR